MAKETSPAFHARSSFNGTVRGLTENDVRGQWRAILYIKGRTAETRPRGCGNILPQGNPVSKT